MTLETIIQTAMIVIGVLGFGWIQKTFFGMVLKTTIEMLIRESIDREKAQKALIFETITVMKSNEPDEEDEDNINNLPVTTSELNKLKDEMEYLKVDMVMVLPHFNKNLEEFRIEVVKIVEASLHSPELTAKLIDHFLEMKRMVYPDE